MNRDTTLPRDDANINRIRRDILTMFEQSIGWRFRIKGTNLTDIVAGVDREEQHVCGKQYGNFHVDLCEITSQEPKTSN